MNNWYEESFGEDYLLVYKHRDMQGAAVEVRKMIAWLELPGQSHVLDLCCGMGRHAMALAEAGFRVTGVDLSPVLLKKARASDPANRIRWIESDMRSLPCDETFIEGFDAVVNLFTSFGYFEEDEEQLKVLKQIRQALKPGGRFIIDYINARYTVDHLVFFSERKVGENAILETRRIQDGFVTKEIIVLGSGRPARRYRERIKLYSLDTLTDLLDEAGLAIDNVHGNYNEALYDDRLSPRMIMVGHRI
ncbi:class I SAM-dependent methyltransferase [Cohnella silvisoli]|uniref:Methyltransferase domain-containing protein n=1 Tax=Cohnella silvisoli TaxID=2873699 RepID=A0ABV1KQU1_9BACL|nr:class I SAM-dependent methyltransferase [Cohnella silvisoli]MCD9024565.1 methyltransferase domain-containing protein [Cohnella silvisoli]